MATAQPSTDYWTAIEGLCGQAFEGAVREAPAGDTAFENKRLVMHVRSCTPDEIRIPFVVGDDRSRTWVLTRHDGMIRLKHDHRHEDGTPDEVTMYGGTATNHGRADQQFFPADEETRGVTPVSLSNVWTMAVTPGETFTYGLWRLGTPRIFMVDFDLSRPVDPPLPPWGAE